MNPAWFTEDGTFIGPWWLRWAWLAVALLVPVVWIAITLTISAHVLMGWALFLAALNMLRAKEAYEPVARWLLRRM